MFSYYYKFLPQANEIMSGPSGVSYETALTGTPLSTFATYTNEFMTALGMSSVTSWQNNTTDLQTFATDVNIPHVVLNRAYAYQQQGNTAGTVIDGQDKGYESTPALEISAIQSYVSANWTSGAPLFVEALGNAATLAPDDMLYIAQQLELNKASGQEYVFLTPSESALTEANYYNSGSLSAVRNVQALPGTYLLKQAPINYMQNGSGLERERITGGWSLGTTGNNETLMNGIPYLGYTANRLETAGPTTNSVAAQASLTSIPIAGGFYHFTVNVAGSGTVELGVYNGSAWHYTSTVTLTAAYQTLDLISAAPASGGLMQVILPAQSSAATVYFVNNTLTPQSWAMIGTGTGVTVPEDLNTTTYDYGQALVFTLPPEGKTEEIYQYPTVKASTSYVWSADVAGSGSAYLGAYEGGVGLCTTSTVTLSAQYHTLSCTASTASSGTPGLFVITPANASAQTIYVRNASVTPPLPTDFTTGVETGQTQLTWTNTVDTTSPGGNESNVTSAVLQLTTSAMSHGGSNAIQYGGTASGGTANYAYMEAFSNSTVLTSTSRLSYWIFPQSPLGTEPNASSTTGLNSTCVAIDIIFTDGTTLRGSTRTDQNYNLMHPAHQCNHLHPDQWNYVTSDLSPLSGKTISRIDIGYDQPNAPAGSYRGYVDDISLTH
jgi:hypothetical protein